MIPHNQKQVYWKKKFSETAQQTKKTFDNFLKKGLQDKFIEEKNMSLYGILLQKC